MVEGENGQPMAVGARELVRMESPRPGVFNGEDFQKIDKAEIVHEITEVVEIAFVDDAVVLAWLFPQRRPPQRRANAVGDRGRRMSRCPCLGK